jgi:two-component system, oxyanion-binding sensor
VWFPWRSHAAWFVAQMQRWGWLAPDIDRVAAARAVYRPDLLAAAAEDEGLSWPEADSKCEGAHATEWMCAAKPAPLAMTADRFCDGVVFGS